CSRPRARLDRLRSRPCANTRRAINSRSVCGSSLQDTSHLAAVDRSTGARQLSCLSDEQQDFSSLVSKRSTRGYSSSTTVACFNTLYLGCYSLLARKVVTF